MKFSVKLFTIATAFAALNPLLAATISYEAVTDFTDINAGEVPYYRHNGVGALAINAAIELYRDQFARATVEFQESTGVYDVTITSLGEIDGDGEFRFLVDGVVVGSAVNSPATEDYGEQLHLFENISIPEGALIGVESVAVSNGQVPEGDAFAYARGRWTTLTISDAVDEPAPVTPDPVEYVDLAVTLSTSQTSALTGDDISHVITVDNLSAFVATTPVVVVSLPAGITNPVSDSCDLTDANTLTCALPELPPNGSSNVELTTTATSIGEKAITASVSADQEDNVASNNSSSAITSVENTPVVVDPPLADDSVDLELTASSTQDNLEVGDTLSYVFTVTNLHGVNTATAPRVVATLSDSLQFVASDICVADLPAITITCNLEELAPGAQAEASFSATAVKVNSYSQLFATASSAQTESIVSNNEIQVITDIRTETLLNIVPVTDQPIATDNTLVETNSKDSGGGAFHWLALLLLLLPKQITVRRWL